MTNSIIEYFKNFDPKPANILKVVGVAILALIILSFAIRLIGSSVNSLFGMRSGGTMGIAMPGIGGGMGGGMPSFDIAIGESTISYGKGGGMMAPADSRGLSIRNIFPIPPINQGTTGSDAEEFEVTDYNATIETRMLEETCGIIADLKTRSYVIFENSNETDRGCNYTFKVAKANVAEILSIVKGLDPKELSESTYTIKNQVEDFTSETEILQKKKASIDETLKNAIDAYDDITALATKTQDVETLAKIINSRLQLIERLTQERININEQLDRIGRAKAEQLDRLEYTYFHLNVFENKYIDLEDLKDSWKAAIRAFVNDMNKIVQDSTIGLIGFLLFVLMWILYFFVLLFIGKYAWRWARSIWNK